MPDVFRWIVKALFWYWSGCWQSFSCQNEGKIRDNCENLVVGNIHSCNNQLLLTIHSRFIEYINNKAAWTYHLQRRVLWRGNDGDALLKKRVILQFQVLCLP